MLSNIEWHILAPEGTIMPKTRLNIYLNQQQKEKLEKLSEKHGAPLSELVRRAIDFYLEKHK
jgi:predicted DNA-binding protein